MAAERHWWRPRVRCCSPSGFLQGNGDAAAGHQLSESKPGEERGREGRTGEMQKIQGIDQISKYFEDNGSQISYYQK